MKYFALLDNNNLVINISVADDNWDSTGWIDYTNKTCGIGYSYNAEENIFVAPQPYASWSLDAKFDWQPPTPRPGEGDWYWDEPTLTWIESTILGNSEA